MKLIVGLGNPGREYKNTRHNVGFIVVDAYAKLKNLDFKLDKKFKALIAKEKEYIIIKPQTYMNLSGFAVAEVANYYQIDSSDILVVSDDMDLPFCKIRIRNSGSSGGHNGLKSIISSLSTDLFYRLRVGIDKPEEDSISYVLGKMSKENQKELEELTITTNSIIDDFIDGKSYDDLRNTYN